jgi:hypothetical protein
VCVCGGSLSVPKVSTGAGEDNGIDHHKN